MKRQRVYPSGFAKRQKVADAKEKLSKLAKVSDYFASCSTDSEIRVKIRDEQSANDASTVEEEFTGADASVSSEINTAQISLPANSEINQLNRTDSFSTDPGKWTLINEEFRDYWVQKGSSSCQNKDSDFSNSVRCYKESDGKTKNRKLKKDLFSRKLRNGEVVQREWLIYSPSKGMVYCFVCKLFSSTKGSFASHGFNDWKHSSVRISEHENGPDHRQCMLTFISRQKDSENIDCFLTKQFKAKQMYWIEVLKRIVAVIKFLACRGLAFRGENQIIGSPQNGNYLGILELLSQFDPFLKEHIETRGNSGKGRTSYLSANICEEFIALMGTKVLSTIIQEIKRAKYYSLSVDSTPDICHVDQLTFTVRYMKGDTPVERFMEFIPISSHKSEQLSEAILKFLKEKEIAVEDCRGQSYDNASNMAGKYGGVQAKILEVNRTALFVPCSGHSLNLIGVHAISSCSTALHFFDFVQQLYTFFSSSAHRWNVLKEHLKSNVVKRLCDTRWSAHYEAIKALSDGREHIEAALNSLANDPEQAGETKLQASHLHRKIGTLENTFLIYFWNDILQRVNSCNKVFQNPDSNLSAVVSVLESLKNFIQELREQFHQYEEKAKNKLPHADYIDNSKRVTKRSSKMKFHDSGTESIVHRGSEKFKICVFLPIIDSLINEITKRAEAYEKIKNVFSFLMELQETEDETLHEKCLQFAQFYVDDVDPEELFLECQQMKHYLKSANVDSHAASLIYSEIKRKGLESTFPNIEISLRIFLSMMVSNCTGERSFSKLKLIKNELRSTMTQARLNSLSLLSIEHEITKQIDFSDVIREFSSIRTRKENF